MMFDFSALLLTLRLILESCIKNDNFYLKNHEDKFDERFIWMMDF
jgi:hypothetical protein